MFPVVPWQSNACTLGAVGTVGAGAMVSGATAAAPADCAVTSGPRISAPTATAVANLRIAYLLTIDAYVNDGTGAGAWIGTVFP
ncbi:hypothetical protein A5698_08200 [Mycobacterium sp. E136]|nr:hypothetical protein A5698_08200 [Mycobacterium sp. E136]